MHVLYESLGHPAELEFASKVREIVDAALFFDDEDVLTNALHIVENISYRLEAIRAGDLAKASKAMYLDGDSAKDPEWSDLEEKCAQFDAVHHTLVVAEIKLKAALDAIGDIGDRAVAARAVLKF